MIEETKDCFNQEDVITLYDLTAHTIDNKIEFVTPVGSGALDSPRGGNIDIMKHMYKLPYITTMFDDYRRPPIPFPKKKGKLVTIIVSIRVLLSHIVEALRWVEDNIPFLSMAVDDDRVELIKLIPAYRHIIADLKRRLNESSKEGYIRRGA